MYDEQLTIPRPGNSRSFRTMQDFLFNGAGSQRAASTRDRQRGVNFSEDIEMPALESTTSEQQHQLDVAVVDTAGSRSPAQASRTLTRADSFVNLPGTSTGTFTGPGAAAELQGQMPWAYIPSSSNRMRDQLPPDEDLPPVPLPDYTAFQSARKASVHRAASSLSSMTQKKEYLPYQSQRQREAGTAAAAAATAAAAAAAAAARVLPAPPAPPAPRAPRAPPAPPAPPAR